MRPYLSIVLVILTLTGCTSYWTDPSQWQTKFSADATSCAEQARQETGLYTPYDERHRLGFQQCMQGRGWWQPQEQEPRQR